MTIPTSSTPIGIVIVTHGNLGAELLKVLEHVVGHQEAGVHVAVVRVQLVVHLVLVVRVLGDDDDGLLRLLRRLAALLHHGGQFGVHLANVCELFER